MKKIADSSCMRRWTVTVCKNLKSDGIFVTGARDKEIGERDAVTNLYPFMLAAAGEMSDLYTIYYLLRRNHPAVVDCISEGIVMERGYNPVEQSEKRTRLS